MLFMAMGIELVPSISQRCVSASRQSPTFTGVPMAAAVRGRSSAYDAWHLKAGHI